VPSGPYPLNLLSRVVAFRPPQVHPQSHEAKGRAQKWRYGLQPQHIYWFKEYIAKTNTAGKLFAV